MGEKMEKIELWITEVIRNYVNNSPQNSLGLPTGEKAFDEPLVGFSSGGDPLYEEFRSHIGSFYYLLAYLSHTFSPLS